MLLVLHAEIVTKLGLPPSARLAIVGMEVAGVMMVAQLASAANPSLMDKFSFIYSRLQTIFVRGDGPEPCVRST